MRKIYTLLAAVLVGASAYAQPYLSLSMPAGTPDQNLVLTTDFSIAANGAAITGTNRYQIYFVNDSSLATSPAPLSSALTPYDGPTDPYFDGCQSIPGSIAVNVLGKAGMVNRNSCSFQIKADNLIAAGAAIGIICNRDDATIAMGITSSTIPLVMLRRGVCDSIKANLARGLNVELVTTDYRDVGLSSVLKDVSVFPNGATPRNLALNAGDMPTPVGVDVFNKSRTNVYNNVTLAASGAGGYSASSSVSSIPVSSDTVISTRLLDMSTLSMGANSLTYEISSSTPDPSLLDNLVTINTIITDSVLCRGRWDATNGRPISTGGIKPGGANSSDYTMGYFFKNKNNLDRCNNPVKLMKGQFGVTSNRTYPEPLRGMVATVEIYKFEDGLATLDTFPQSSELSIVGTGDWNFTSEANGAWVIADLYDINTGNAGIILEEGAMYYAGVTYNNQGVEDTIFCNFDSQFDYTVNNFLRDRNNLPSYPAGPTGTIAAGSTQPASWFSQFTGGGVVALALHFSKPCQTVGLEPVVDAKIFMNVFPNPTSETLVVDATVKEDSKFVEYSIISMDGKVMKTIRHENVSGDDQARFNVADFAAGTYQMQLRTERGVRVRPFVVLANK